MPGCGRIFPPSIRCGALWRIEGMLGARWLACRGVLFSGISMQDIERDHRELLWSAVKIRDQKGMEVTIDG
jgi:hypothetical protein